MHILESIIGSVPHLPCRVGQQHQCLLHCGYECHRIHHQYDGELITRLTQLLSSSVRKNVFSGYRKGEKLAYRKL